MISALNERPAHPTSHAAVCSLADCRALLNVFGPERYTASTPLLPGGTVGQHARHLLDHFSALFRAAPDAPIDYDARARGTEVETSFNAAIDEIDRLSTLLRAVDAARAEAPVTVRLMIRADGTRAVHASTLGREVAFAVHHAVHHHAMIAAIARDIGLKIPEGAGLAPATRHHHGHARSR